ncbi:hypothetical protein [Gymnodinialimonas sp.]
MKLVSSFLLVMGLLTGAVTLFEWVMADRALPILSDQSAAFPAALQTDRGASPVFLDVTFNAAHIPPPAWADYAETYVQYLYPGAEGAFPVRVFLPLLDDSQLMDVTDERAEDQALYLEGAALIRISSEEGIDYVEIRPAAFSEQLRRQVTCSTALAGTSGVPRVTAYVRTCMLGLST